jgi:hypothetical protein
MKKINILPLFKVISILVIGLLLCFTGCQDEPEEDTSISEITIYNIPEKIPVFGDEAVSAFTFKIYLNASNTQEASDPPAAKAVAKISDGVLEDGTYTITIQLENPNPSDKPDPNEDTGSWSGTARYFSVMISPNDVTAHQENAIWVQAGTTLNKGKKRMDWKKDFINFRAMMKTDPTDEMKFADKNKSLFEEIICKDPEIKF